MGDADPSRVELELTIGYVLDNEPPPTLAGCSERVRTMQAIIRQLTRENESLRAECGLRQIAGYEKGVAAERERCARICEEPPWPSTGIENHARRLATAIRSGGT